MSLPISLFLSTRNRSHSLQCMLASLHNLDRKGLELEVVCVDNGSTDDTQAILAAYASGLRLKVLHHEGAGLSAARNLALDYLCNQHSGDRLVIATDDDIEPDIDWLRQLHQAAVSHGKGHLFGGRILPHFASKTRFTDYLLRRHMDLARPLFAIYEWPPGTLQPPALPFGPNMAFFLDAVRKLRYDTRFGYPHCIGEETDLGRRLIKSGSRNIYVENASVRHHVRPEQAQLPWMLQRMRDYGVSEARLVHKHYPESVDKVCYRLHRKRRNYHLRRPFRALSANATAALRLKYEWHTCKLQELQRCRETPTVLA